MQRTPGMKLVLASVLALVAGASPLASPAQDAAAIFNTRCAICHGADGHGDTPAGRVLKAASLVDPMVTDKSNEELFAIIHNGRNKMPAWKDKLTDRQIEAVIAYVRSLPQ